MRRTIRLRPSCNTSSTSAFGGRLSSTRKASALTGPSSRSIPASSCRATLRATGPGTSHRYVFGTPYDGCIRRWARSPSLVSSSRPSLSASSRPTWNTRCGRSPTRSPVVGHRREHARRLVHHQVDLPVVGHHPGAVDVDRGRTGVDLDAERGDLAVDGEPAVGDQLLTCAARSQSGRGEHLLQPYRRGSRAGSRGGGFGRAHGHSCVSARASRSLGRNGASGGSSSVLSRPSFSRNSVVVPYRWAPFSGSMPRSSIRPRVSSVRITPSQLTPRIAEIRDRVTGCLYATTASVSSAAWVSRVCWPSNTNRSTYGAYAGRV